VAARELQDAEAEPDPALAGEVAVLIWQPDRDAAEQWDAPRVVRQECAVRLARLREHRPDRQGDAVAERSEHRGGLAEPPDAAFRERHRPCLRRWKPEAEKCVALTPRQEWNPARDSPASAGVVLTTPGRALGIRKESVLRAAARDGRAPRVKRSKQNAARAEEQAGAALQRADESVSREPAPAVAEASRAVCLLPSFRRPPAGQLRRLREQPEQRRIPEQVPLLTQPAPAERQLPEAAPGLNECVAAERKRLRFLLPLFRGPPTSRRCDASQRAFRRCSNGAAHRPYLRQSSWSELPFRQCRVRAACR
jgi:hypothetical protein